MTKKKERMTGICPECGAGQKAQSILINLILDRSGSMGVVQDATIKAVNEFIKEQKDVPGEAKVSMYLFDDEYDVVYKNRPIKQIQKLNTESYVPRGMTALYDAVAKTVATVKEDLKGNRPDKVLFVIVTDGEENASKEISSHKEINKIVTDARKKSKFEFLYLGADQDAWNIGRDLGICNTFNFAQDNVGESIMYTSAMTKAYRASAQPTTDSFYGDVTSDEDIPETIEDNK